MSGRPGRQTGAPGTPRPADTRKPPQAARQAPGEVRIIGGDWRRSKLPVPVRPGLRPTPDRVRETLFNWLGQDLSGWRVLDAFAGSGALGLEAASRGAAAVTLVERDADLVRGLRQTVQRLKGEDRASVVAADALAWMARAPRAAFELVLLDPPFDAGLFAPALAAAAPLVAPSGWLYLEAPTAFTDWPAGFECWRQGQAGAVHHHLLQRTG